VNRTTDSHHPQGAPSSGRALVHLLLGSLVAAAMACGGGGGSSGPTAPPPPPTSGIVFTSSGTGAASSVNLASGGGSTNSTLVLEVQASQVQDLFGVAFNLSYPSQLLRFEGATEGTFLSEGGAVSTSLQAVESPTGTVVLGLSRFGAVPGVRGSGTLVTLRFSAVSSGTGSFTFSRNTAVSSTGTSISGFTWTGGTVKVAL
jgi:Cohesin domain